MSSDRELAFRVAAEHRLKFGRYRGLTLDRIAETDEGLLYLDSIVDRDWLWERDRQQIVTYLADPVIRHELEALLDRR